MPTIWIFLKRPIYLIFYPLVPVLAFFMGALSENLGVFLAAILVLTSLYCDICFYLVLFSGTDPIILSGVDIRKTKGFFLFSLIFQTIFFFFLMAFSFGSLCFMHFFGGWFIFFSWLVNQGFFRYLAFSKFSLEFILTCPDLDKPVLEKFMKDLSKILVDKLNEKDSVEMLKK